MVNNLSVSRQKARNSVVMVFVLTALLTLSGCGGNSLKANDYGERLTPETPTRVLNVLTGATAPATLNVVAPSPITGERIPSGSLVKFDYKMIASDTVSLTLTNTDSDGPEIPVLTADVNKDKSTKGSTTRTIILYGVLGVEEEARKPQTFVLSDPKVPDGLGDKFAAVRVVHLAPSVGAVDVYNGDQVVLGLTNITAKNPTPYRFIAVDGAKLTIRDSRIVPTPRPTDEEEDEGEEEDDETPAGQLNLPYLAKGTKLLPGKAYSIILYGEPNADPAIATLDATIVQDP